MNIRDQIREDIKKTVDSSPFENSQGEQLAVDGLEIEIRRSDNPKFGDFSTNVALKIASSVIARTTFSSHERGTKQSQKKIATSHSVITNGTRNDGVFHQSPMEIANILADSLKDLPYIKKLQAANPGFVNFYLKDSVWQDQVKEVFEGGKDFGSNSTGRGKKARVEFVSANPTGPLHFGNARGGPSGDVLANILGLSGYEVLREYYNNDVGVQVEKLGETIVNVADGKKLEEQEYKGEYIQELVKKITNYKKESLFLRQARKLQNSKEVGREAVKILSEENLADCGAMGIKFDKVFNESDFIESGKTEEAVEFLKDKKVLIEKDGATWFAPSDEFLKDRETVVIKSDGSYTYFANDIAYHRLKFSDGYDLVVDVMGANHHGHVPRLNAAISALGFDVSNFKVILYQWVRFRKHGKPFSMSKRAGNFITAREVLDEIGSDALRFMLLMYDTNSPIDFDIDLAKEKSVKNPVYYVQYAYARICSILAKVKSDLKYSSSETRGRIEKFSTSSNNNFSLLTTNFELDLIKQISRLPELVEDISRDFEVHHLTKYAMELADSFHKFYENCKVIGEEKELMEARLALVEATKITLGNTFRLLGVSAPEKM